MQFVIDHEEFDSGAMLRLNHPRGASTIFVTADYSRVFVQTANQIEGSVVHECDDFEIRHLIDWHGVSGLEPARRADGLHKRTSALMKWP